MLIKALRLPLAANTKLEKPSCDVIPSSQSDFRGKSVLVWMCKTKTTYQAKLQALMLTYKVCCQKKPCFKAYVCPGTFLTFFLLASVQRFSPILGETKDNHCTVEIHGFVTLKKIQYWWWR